MREALEIVVAAGDGTADGEALSIYGRTRLLRRVQALTALAPEDLIVLAASSEMRVLQAGQRLPSPREPQHSFFVTLADELVLQTSDGSMIQQPPFSVFTFEPGAPTVLTVADTHLIRIEPTPVFELAAEEPEIIPGLLHAAEALSGAAA